MNETVTGPKPMAAERIGPRDESTTIILLNAIELHSEFLSLYL